MSRKKKNNKNESQMRTIAMLITALAALLSAIADIIEALN